MTRAVWPVLVILAMTPLAGCLGDGAPEAAGADEAADATGRGAEVTATRLPPPTEDLSTAISADHGGIPDGHAIPALHEGSYGLELVGYNPLTRPMAGDSLLGSDSGYTAIDTWQDYVCVTHFAGTTGFHGGATIVDIADPAAPVVVSTIESSMLNSDCQFTDDGAFLVLAAYTGVHEGAAGLPPLLADTLAQGVEIWDVSDKAAPQFVVHDAQGAGGGGYHNVFTATIADQVWIFQTYTGNILRFDPEAGTVELVTKVEAADHDIWVGRHAITGGWLMITGLYPGIVIYNVDDPAEPVLLDSWEAPEGFDGWHRQWPLMQTVEGHALLVVAGETGGGDTLPYTVLDITDPADIQELGNWQIPGAPVSSEPNFFTMSAHEFETWDGYVATGNYHAGVWVFDIGTMERAKAPVTIGYYLPHEIPQAGGGVKNTPWAFNPDTWGAYFDERGYVVTADWWSGLYVLKFGATTG